MINEFKEKTYRQLFEFKEDTNKQSTELKENLNNQMNEIKKIMKDMKKYSIKNIKILKINQNEVLEMESSKSQIRTSIKSLANVFIFTMIKGYIYNF